MFYHTIEYNLKGQRYIKQQSIWWPTSTTLRLNYPDTYNQSDSMDVCTCGGLYCFAEPIANGFHLPCTRLAFKHLRPLSYQRLGSPATLTTWVSTLYVRLTGSLEFHDAILTWILTKLYNEAPPRNFRGITS